MIKKLITALVGNIFLLLMAGGIGKVDIMGVVILPQVAIVSSILYIILPSIFDIGVSGWDRASLYEKSFPIITVICIMIVTRNILQTYAVVGINSFLLGGVFTYIGKVWDSK